MVSDGTCRALIETDGTPIDVTELTEFLYHFRAAYAAVMADARLNDTAVTDISATDAAASLRSRLGGLQWQQINELAYMDLHDGQLGIVDIQRQNPLIIVFSGVAIALAAAVIVSGGHYKLGPLEVTLPPLGVGVARLRDAFGRRPRPPRGGPGPRHP